MKNKTATTFSKSLGLAIISGTLTVPLTAVADNPFSATDIGNGYQLASKDAEGKCGEGKCGEAAAKQEAEGKCGEGKCGESKSAEGKCGEGKCGESK